MNALPFTLISWGKQFIDSGLAGILNATATLFVFQITLLWTRHEPATAQKLVGVLCGFAGVALIVGVDALLGLGQHTLGELAASGCYAWAAINGRRLTHFSPVITAASTMRCSCCRLAWR